MQSGEAGEGQEKAEGGEATPPLPQWVQESLKRMTGLDKRLHISSEPSSRAFEEVTSTAVSCHDQLSDLLLSAKL